jgi:hypothetical protein
VRLHSRIRHQAGNQAAASASYHPWGTPDTPVTMPAHLTTYTPAGAMFEELGVIIAPNGAPIYAATAHPWGTVRSAGRA